MHYLERDVAYLLRKSPYLRLARLASALRFVRAQVEAGSECVETLALYPGLRIDALEFHYACLFGLGALDDDLLDDLLTEFNWRGVVWGSFLAMLRPRAAFAQPLSATIERVPRNRWLVESALDLLCGRQPAPERRAFVTAMEQLGSLLALAPDLPVPLRRMPTERQRAQLRTEQERIRAVYHQSGLTGALAAREGTLMALYTQPYLAWIRAVRSSKKARKGY